MQRRGSGILRAMLADRKLTGSAGEHFVCSQLAQLGWAASLTRDGLERTDILAVHSDTREMIEVQVKTMTWNRKPMWALGQRGTIPAVSDREWYVLVLLPREITDRPRCWVVPRNHVAAGTWIAHMNWLTDPAAEPGKRNAGIGSARAGIDVWSAYAEEWELLHDSAYQAPVLLPQWMRRAAVKDRVGLPDGHPWHDELPEFVGPEQAPSPLA